MFNVGTSSIPENFVEQIGVHTALKYRGSPDELKTLYQFLVSKYTDPSLQGLSACMQEYIIWDSLAQEIKERGLGDKKLK